MQDKITLNTIDFNKLYGGDMMNVNIRLDGVLEKGVVNEVKSGLAGSKAEVIRVALREHFEKKREIADKEDEEIRAFVMENSNRDIWEDKKEDAVWNKY